MYLLIIGNYLLFISTYLVSIFAAVYGVTKFFRLSHSHIVRSLLSRKFAAVCLVTTVYFILKGVTLLSIVQGACYTDIYESVLWWFLFTMAPTSILVFSFSVIQSCIKLQKNIVKEYKRKYIKSFISSYLSTSSANSAYIAKLSISVSLS